MTHERESNLLELRVLAGLQAGARLNLAPGRHVLGRGEECDIVLAGPGIELSALILLVDGAQLHLEPRQPGCGLTAGDSLSEPFMLEPGIPFHVGDIWLVVDHQASPWPENRSWLVSMPPPLSALSIDSAETAIAAQGEVKSKPLRTSGEPRLLLLWLKWAAWCIAVFCLGGLGLLAWFKFGIEYLPNMRAMTATHLSRLAEAPVAGTGVQAVQARTVEPAPVVAQEPRAQTPPAPELVLLGPAATAAPLARSPMLGLPLAGSHLVQGRSHVQTERIANTDTASAAELARLPFLVRQVACGNVASITTDKGVKLFEGASHKGYELTRVSAERLRLRGLHDMELSC